MADTSVCIWVKPCSVQTEAVMTGMLMVRVFSLDAAECFQLVDATEGRMCGPEEVQETQIVEN